MKEKIIYSLNTTDIQTVANQELNRKLTKEEIEKISEIIPERIDWYDIISCTIYEIIRDNSGNN